MRGEADPTALPISLDSFVYERTGSLDVYLYVTKAVKTVSYLRELIWVGMARIQDHSYLSASQ